MSIRTFTAFSATAGAVSLALLLSACGGQQAPSGEGLSGSVAVDGSSTVAPLAEAAAGLYAEVEPEVQVTVGTSGTGGGFEKFCAAETDISTASREIKDEEAAKCAEAGVEFTEILIANDGLSVIVNPENTWAKDLTVAQLATIWAPAAEGKVMSWKDVDPSFPDVKIEAFGPGTDSGTFDFFTKAINGEEGASRTDYSASEDDNVIVQGVAGAKGGIGYLGLSYAELNAQQVKLVSVDGVMPSIETVQDGTYTPLGRPLFIYVNNANFADNKAVKGFVEYFVDNAELAAEDALLVGLTAEQLQIAKDELAALEK